MRGGNRSYTQTPEDPQINLKPSVHNVVLIVAIAVLGILALRMAAKTGLAGVPVVGSVVKTAATA